MKLTLNNITSGFASATATNTNNDLVEAAIENTLSRDGTGPNQMLSNLDMNGYAILNQRATSGNENFVWLGTWVTGTTYAVNNLVYAPEGTNEGATLICVAAHTAGATLNDDAAKWAVFAQRGASGAGTGDVIGPASSIPDSLAKFSGTTGKLLKDGAVIGTDVLAYDAGLAATTVFAKTLLDDTDAATMQATLGIASTKRTFTAQQTPKAGALTDGATIDWNGDVNGQVVTLTLGGNRTMAAPTNIVQNTMYMLRVAQDATGSRTLLWDAAYKFGAQGKPTLTTTASKVDFISFVGGASNTLECLGTRLNAV